jgi:hypothetical protein
MHLPSFAEIQPSALAQQETTRQTSSSAKVLSGFKFGFEPLSDEHLQPRLIWHIAFVG